MEIRHILQGETASFSPAVRPAQSKESKTRTSVDRLELTQQLVQTMEEQQTRLESLLRNEKKSNGILDLLDESSGEEQELDALSKELDVKMKCMKIAANMMRGKKVPPEDERYLMENDPDGYKLAIAMKAMVKEDKKECKSVLEDEDKNETSKTSESGESAPAETSGGEAAE